MSILMACILSQSEGDVLGLTHFSHTYFCIGFSNFGSLSTAEIAILSAKVAIVKLSQFGKS